MHKEKPLYLISAVSKMFDIHPQTLRLYEREGLVAPSRTDGNTRLYSERDVELLEEILTLTRDFGVNLAGVQVILQHRRRLGDLQQEFTTLFREIEAQLAAHHPEAQQMVKAITTSFQQRFGSGTPQDETQDISE